MLVRELIEKLQKCDPESAVEESNGDEIMAISQCQKELRVSTFTETDDAESLGEEWKRVE